MKASDKFKIYSEKLMKNEELVKLRGGVEDCAYRPCKKTSDCCTGNPVCMEPIGWPGDKYCFSN
jgi:hypothetical protein